MGKRKKVKKEDVKLNRMLKMSFIICLISGIIALVLILGKGKVFGKSIIKISSNEEDTHTIEIVAQDLYLMKEQSTQLKVLIDGKEVTEGYEITVEKPDIFSLEGNTVTALAVGSSVISVKSTDYNIEAKTNIDVIIPITKLTLTAEMYNIALGDTVSTFYQLRPTDAVAILSYESSDETIATVDNEGKVKSISKGTVTITATDEITGKTATCKINIK